MNENKTKLVVLMIGSAKQIREMAAGGRKPVNPVYFSEISPKPAVSGIAQVGRKGRAERQQRLRCA